MPNAPSSTNVMTVSLQDTSQGPFVRFSPNALRILKGNGPGRFRSITLKYPAENQNVAERVRQRLDPNGTRNLGTSGAIEFTLTEDINMFTGLESPTFTLQPGQEKTFTLAPALGVQPGGTFEHPPSPALARGVNLQHRFPGVTSPVLTLNRAAGGHVDWHVEC